MTIGWQCWEAVIRRAENEIDEDLSNLDLVFTDLPVEVFGELLLASISTLPR